MAILLRCLLGSLPLAAMLLGCVTTEDYGYGECREYSPVCIFGEEVCEVDEKGCEFCTCER
jgi:hypothetical protein